MLDRLAAVLVRRRRLVLVGALAFLVIAGVLGGSVADHLSAGGFDDKGSESYRATQVLADEFGSANPNLLLLVDAPDGATVDDPAVVQAGNALTAELAAEPSVGQVVSYWSLGSPPPLKGRDGRQALVLARIDGNDNQVDKRSAPIVEKYTRSSGSSSVISVRVGGQGPIFREIGDTIQSDLARAEAITIPITMLLLILIFGSVVAASLPLAVGVFSVLGTFLALRVLASLVEVSVYSLNLTTAMGLGLAIDYSLFIVSRYREELRAGYDTAAAIRRTLQTAGRTVVFSAATVAISLGALLVFPLAFLRSFAYAGIAVVALAGIGAVIVLPALLAVLGPRIDKLRIGRRRHTAADAHAREGAAEGRFWHRLAVNVMRRPVVFGLAVVAVLLVLAAPFRHLDLGLPDDRVLPASASSRQVSDAIRNNFGSRETAALSIVAPNLGDPKQHTADIEAYATGLSRLAGAARVDAVTGSYANGQRILGPSAISARFEGTNGTWFSVVPSVEPLSADGERLAKAVRTSPAPFETQVTGPSAELVDSKDSLLGRLPLAAGIIALVTFVLMFLFTGSLIVPIKALVLNLFSLTATFGAMVYIFQEGHGSDLLDFTATGTIAATMPILMFCIAFGLSMDYEVFLLSRIKEEHDRTGDNERSVALGLERTGRIVSAAAALLAFVFIAFASSDIQFIKLFGIGLALAVLMDATLVRGVLVPAFMRLAGEANWWAPKPLRAVYRRIGLHEADLDDELAKNKIPAGEIAAAERVPVGTGERV